MILVAAARVDWGAREPRIPEEGAKIVVTYRKQEEFDALKGQRARMAHSRRDKR